MMMEGGAGLTIMGRPPQQRDNNRKQDTDKSSGRFINMNDLEGAGFVHLHG